MFIVNFGLTEDKYKINYYGLRGKVFNSKITYKFPDVIHATS